MKIALVTPYDYPYPGGVTEHIAALDRQFRALGHDTRIIAASTTDEDVLGEHVIKVSGAVSPVPFSGSTARITLSPQVYRRVKKILHDEKFDVVHVHEPTVPVLSLIVLRHSHAVNVGTFHAYRESNAMYEYMRPLLQRVFNRLDGRIFVSEAVRAYITRYFPGDYTIIPNGIDCERFAAPDVEPIQQFCDGRPNILFVGRLEKRKGFRYLIRAFPHIKQAVPDARLIVVGAFSDADKAPFLRYARTHRLHAVHFVGYVPPEELPRYYRTATLFCAPSTGFESFGIILLEAMAAGLPIVATDIAGYRQVVENERDGVLVAPNDEHALARAMTRLLRDPARRTEMAHSAQLKAAQYDWSIIAQRVLAYYDELIAAQPGPSSKPRSSAGKRRIVRVRHLLNWRRLGRRKRVAA
ncbi:MAG: glycosyltransferase family 4 protein [Chloroflexi bacterium]|nr:glycosyltransferase family 4 protein [Chloroflexota bacterium]